MFPCFLCLGIGIILVHNLKCIIYQCRHKAMGLVASCKNKKKNKPCTTSYCKNCLLNRLDMACVPFTHLAFLIHTRNPNATDLSDPKTDTERR